MPEFTPGNTIGEADLNRCIELCLQCHRTCLDAIANICLPHGGRHAERGHVTLMYGCADLCRTAAGFMISGSLLQFKVCGVCAEVCEACAVSCQMLDGMEECVHACRQCADSCRRMALGMSAEA
jgi:hypothetical protein